MSRNDWVSALPWIFAAAAPQLIVGLGKLYRGSGVSDAGTDTGSIRPDPVITWIGIVMFGAFVVGGIAMMFMRLALAGLLSALFGGVLLAFMLPSLHPSQIVKWDDDGLEGPCKTWGLTLGTKRTFVRWQELVKAGKTASMYWYVEAEDGRCVFWSSQYPGWGALTAALYRKCPKLALPPDMHLPGGPPRG